VFGVVLKKALLQSAPWVVLTLIVFMLSWWPWSRLPPPRRRQLRLLSIVTGAVLATFALSGVRRNDGLAFNQRYLMELLPFAAVAAAWALDDFTLRIRALAVGVVTGTLLVTLVLRQTPVIGGAGNPLWIARQLLILRTPLLLSSALAVCWVFSRRGARLPSILSWLVGLCLGWGMMLHLANDLLTSRWIRHDKQVISEAMGRVLTNGTALVAYRWYAEPAVPLLFTHDIVIVDPQPDAGADAPTLIHELLGRGRRVFVLEDGLPPDIRARVLAGFTATRVPNERVKLLELK
jgi:hypothetical protein